MQDDQTKLLVIFHNLRELQQSYDNIRTIKGRLQNMVDSDIELDALLASPNFESKLANHVHPHMHSFPYPIGQRFSDVGDLIAPNGRQIDSKNETGEGNYRHFLDDILPIFRNGYSICMGKSFSPSNSGLNIDPRTFTFRARSEDILRYFPDSEKSNDTKEYKESSSKTLSHPPLLHPDPETETESKPPTLGGESMICNYPPSEYTETFLREISDENSSPVPPIPTGTDDFGYVNDVIKKQSLSVSFSLPGSIMSVRDSIICHPPSMHHMSLNESSSHSNESSSHSNESQISLESECNDSIDRFTKLYATPRSKLCDDNFEGMHDENIKSFVVSQTWLTGWIRELYLLDAVINKRT